MAPPLRLVQEPRPQRRVIENGVLGTLIFIGTELMFFSGLVSAFTIVSAREPVWPPPGQPRLPVEATAGNTLALLASGITMALALRAFDRAAPSTRALLALTAALGVFFVGFQGVEWVKLIAQGLTLVSSTHGSFFYFIVGLHGLHALAAIAAVVVCAVRQWRASLDRVTLHATAAFWFFVVGVWPLLYWRVYLR